MLQEQVLATIRYFDVQDHPLTAVEISKYLLTENAIQKNADQAGQAKAILTAVAEKGSAANASPTTETRQPHSLAEILDILASTALLGAVDTKDGFYFLKGRSALAERRLKNNFYASARIRRIKKYLPLARFIPFVSAVALTGSEALVNSKEGSDIDLLVLGQRNRMWLTRLCVAAFFQMFGVRRYAHYVADRFCLNHYIAEGKYLGADQNVYTAIEYLSLIPYFGGAEVREFQEKNIAWIQNYIAEPRVIEYQTPRSSRFKKTIDFIFKNSFGDFAERLARALQRRRIRLQEHVTVEEDELSFHPGSKGQQVLEKAKASRIL